MTDKLKIGVLSLQGCVTPHQPHIEACGAEYVPVKTADAIKAVDALILPGGESSTMLKLIRNYNLYDTIWKFCKTKPCWGICAGAILLAEKVLNPAQDSFGILPITVERNGYGRQLDSHYAEIEGIEVPFIRAPVIKFWDGDKVTVKAKHRDDPVWLEYNHAMATTFHPELTFSHPSPMHKRFLEIVREARHKLSEAA